MLEVAQWIVGHTPFDRLYFYGDDLPIHVSYGPDQSRQVVLMSAGKSGKLIPRVISSEAFLDTGYLLALELANAQNHGATAGH